MESKIYSTCKQLKTLNQFTKNLQKKDNLSNYCKDCTKAKSKKYSRSIPGVVSKLYASQLQRTKINKLPAVAYTKKELCKWLLSQPHFYYIYSAWVSSGYLRDYAPSVDRLEDYLGYSLTNIQLVVFKENRLKASFDIKEGRNNKLSKKVVQKSIDGVLLNTFHSLREAERCTDIRNSTISKCCNGLLLNAGGFVWEYVYE